MTIKIGLDLAVRTCGLAILEEEKLIKYVSLVSKEKNYLKLQVEMVDWILSEILSFIVEKPHQVNLEDLFYSANFDSTKWACRTQGAFLDRYFQITKKHPLLVMATTVRKAAGIESWADKAKIQLFIIDKFKLGEVSQNVRGEVIRLETNWDIQYKKLMQNKKEASKVLKEKISRDLKELNRITKNSFNRLSTEIKKQTKIDEHISDSIVLALYKGKDE